MNLIPLALPLWGRKRRPPAWNLQLLSDGVGTVIAGTATDGPAGVAAGSTEVEALNWRVILGEFGRRSGRSELAGEVSAHMVAATNHVDAGALDIKGSKKVRC